MRRLELQLRIIRITDKHSAGSLLSVSIILSHLLTILTFQKNFTLNKMLIENQLECVRCERVVNNVMKNVIKLQMQHS